MEKIKLNSNNKKYDLYIYITKFKYIIFIITLFINETIRSTYKKIGIVGLPHSTNIGNNLLKYAIYIKLSELGFEPYIIGERYNRDNISFILTKIKVRLITKGFTEINKTDYDILMVNSDQTWRRNCAKFFYDIVKPLMCV